MKVLFAASEGAPYIKTGGLGDVIQGLPVELAKNKENEIYLFLPFYESIKTNPNFDIEFVTDFSVPLSWRNQHCGLFKAKSKQDNLQYYFIDNDYYFKRDGYYGYYDDGERFAFFSRAILEALLHMDFTPEIIHCHDWQTAMLPVYLKSSYCHMKRFADIKVIFTIHNIEYQGIFPHPFYDDVIALPPQYRQILDYNGCTNFMKGAIELSDKVTTVSKTYSQEIMHSYFAHGIEHCLRNNSEKLDGIVNGIDCDIFNAFKDKKIQFNYKPGQTNIKYKNKAYLQEKLGLNVDESIPVVSMITRLVSHKGLDLLEYIAHDLLSRNIQLVILGTGDAKFEDLFKRLSWEYKGKVSANIMFNATLASEIYAGSDLFLMPSKSEPCGLSQLICMRYGTIPIVRETGGLVDTVPPIDLKTLKGTGFTFKLYNAHDMLGAIDRALEFYEDKTALKKVITSIMKYDCSWQKPTEEYQLMYKNLVK